MILLDTNIVSETMRPMPARKVVEWVNSQAVETLFLSAVSLAELLSGIAALPEGRRKAGLSEALDEQMRLLFSERILSFDASAAYAYAAVVTTARRAGRPIGHADAQIAAIATIHDFTMASRDAAPFETVGLRVVNPWLS